MDIELTEDEMHWIGVSLENSLEGAKRLQGLAESHEDLDDALDAGLLIQRYTELQRKFPTPEIGLRG